MYVGTSVVDIMDKVRINVSDRTQQVGYKTSELLAWINSANRFLRRIIINYKPMLLAERFPVPPAVGVLDAGQSSVVLPSMPIKFLDVRINNNRITAVSVDAIDNLTDKGTPENYYLFGVNELCFYPTPTVPVNYSIIYVPEYIPLKETGNLPLSPDFDDMVIEYTTIRSQLKDEFSMSDELSIMGSIADQVRQMLTGIENQNNLVEGYFSGNFGKRRGGYHG